MDRGGGGRERGGRVCFDLTRTVCNETELENSVDRKTYASSAYYNIRYILKVLYNNVILC